MARAALQAGRVEEARQYLEEAQLQFVFRPVTPTSDDNPGSSRVAGEVASALSMLGAGNVRGAVVYIDRAAAETREVDASSTSPGYSSNSYASQPAPFGQ
jgi:hypothetical protein